MNVRRVLSGIKPTGASMHLGNECGMNLGQLSADDFLMIADFHALTNPNAQVREWAYTITAELMTLGCAGCVYRQSDVPETFELYWILSNMIGKGHMDRMHAYKAAAGEDVNMGVYTYGILMAADILGVQATHVTVGQDQKQHLELAQILAARLSERYGDGFVYPEAVITGVQDSRESLLGVDGRKMSKSYNNMIPAICTLEELRRCVYKIKTDSTGPSDPKQPETLHAIYKAFATPDRVAELEGLYRSGISWKRVKDMLVECIWEEIEGRHERFMHFNQNRHLVEAEWHRSAVRVKEIVSGTVETIKCKMP